ncbi:MAG: hypothetical protein HDS20_03495 [Bacteroides sp.]|nr:hypothetical protein [Bacteroides sp.]
MNKTEFFDWLIRSGLQENSAESAVSRVKRIEEVYPDLDSRIEDNSFETLLNTFNYTKNDEQKKRFPLHKIAINGNLYNGTQSLRTALAQYIEFKRTTESHVSSPNASKPIASESYIHSIDSDNIYKIEDYRKWMIEKDGMKETSASSYVSFLRRLGKTRLIKNSDGSGVLEIASGALSNGEIAIAFKILEIIDEKLTELYSSSTVSSDLRKDLNNWRSALRKYVYFLQDDSEDIPDEEEFEEANPQMTTVEVAEEYVEGADSGEKITYSAEELKDNFAFRICTQNRMSNDKDIFYPISIIRKLFCYSQRRSEKAGDNNSDYDWFKSWVDDLAGEINVIVSENGNISYSLSEVMSLLLYPATDNVYIISSDTRAEMRVYTQTHDGKIEPMKAKSLSQIHIDHTPLMAKVLTDNIASIPAINALSKEIRSVAKAKGIGLRTANFCKISKMLFADKEYVDSRLLPLIPALKDELNLLRKKYSLTLMQASHNLRKK